MTRTQQAWAGAALALTAGMTLAAGACGVGTLDVTNRPCPCDTGYVCDASRNTCVTPSQLALDSGTPTGACLGDSCSCATATDCKDPAYSKCVDAKCVQCTSGPDTCAAGSYCLATHQCAPGCKADAECKALSPTAPFCNIGRHQCVNCAADTDCANGQKCSPAGACVDACSAGSCAGGKTCCNNLCVDATSDPLNCNACGNACAGAQTACCAGACTDPLTTATSCGKCGFNCNANVMNAGGVACVASACTYATCNATFSDCDGKKTNGCECATPPCGLKTLDCCPGNTCTQGTCEAKPANDGKCH